MRLLAIDPGLANTALVLFDEGAVTEVETIRTPGQGSRPDFTCALERSSHIANVAYAFLTKHRPGAIVCELYRDIPGDLRRARNRWTTPLMLGYLAAGAIEVYQAETCCLVRYQDPELVMRRYASVVSTWKRGGHVVDGDHLITNEHLRSAAAHGLHALDGMRMGGLQ